MNDEYLWDGSGEPDPLVAELEAQLAPVRWKRPAMPTPVRRTRVSRWPLAAAAGVLVTIAGTVVWMMRQSPESDWQSANRRIRHGETLATGDGPPMVLYADDVGRVEIAPRSVVRVLESSTTREKLELRRGTLHALIWAPPARFQVDTASSRAIDLGCQYSLTVDEKGAGMLQVETGWVAFEYRQLESFIPAGAACRTAAGRGPGVPFFADAPESLRRSLAAWEATTGEPELVQVLQTSRPRDALTVWHLLARVPQADRARVYDRLASLVDLRAIDRSRALRLDGRALDAAWDALRLENTAWWREWKRRW
jgi:hypothetical protein